MCVCVPTAGSGLSPNSALINTQDFSLASHIATVNAGIRRGRQGAQGKAPAAAAPQEAAPAAEEEAEAAALAAAAEETAAAEAAAGVTGGQGQGHAGVSAAGPAGATLTAPARPPMLRTQADTEGSPRLSKRHRR